MNDSLDSSNKKSFMPLPRLAAALRWIALVLYILTFPGCGPSAAPKTYPICGTVSFRGEPLPMGVIMLRPQQGPAATSEIGPDGKYQLEAVAGVHTVQVVAVKISEEAKKDDAKLAAAPSLIPRKYNRFDTSGIKVTIQEGQTEPVDINLP